MSLRLPHRRRAALILVVVVIAALLAIAAPFVISMRLHEKSSRAFSAQVRAKQVADGARNMAVVHLQASHPDEERRRRIATGTRQGDEEGVDAHAEVQRFDLPNASGIAPFQVASPTGTMAQVTIKDARARIDLNTSGPDALANLLGATVLAEPLSYREDERMVLADVTPFVGASDGDPETIDGFVRVNGEYVAFRQVNVARSSLEGLVRGFLFSRNQEPEDPDVARELHPAGSLVQDGRGHKLAYDPLWRFMGTERQGLLARFDNTAAIRRIADWEFGTLRAALVLFRYGVNMKLLRQWGVARDDLLGAGLHPADFDLENVERPQETADERRERLEIERTLKRWGVDLEFARRFGGDRALKRIYERLKDMPEDRREKQLQRYSQREEKLSTRLTDMSKWLKDETKRQLEGLTEMRNQAAHLETIGRIELEEKVRPYVTTHSLPEGEAWSDPQVVNHVVQFEPYGFSTRFQIQDTRRFRRGWIVKVQPRRLRAEDPPRPPEYRMCTSVNMNNSVVRVFPQLDFDYEQSELEISCRQPRPINLNTASREVLMAALTGLQSRAGQRARATGRQAPNFVTPDQARAVAEAIVGADAPLETPLDLRNLLLEVRQAGGIDDHDVDAIFRNGLDPADPLLTRATVPFAYRSGDVYELSTTGIVNDPAGNELARHSFREVLRVSPPRRLVWHLDSQADLTDRIYVLGRAYRKRDPRRLDFRGSLPWLAKPGRWSNLLLSRPVQISPYDNAGYVVPSRSHAPGEGDLRALFAREPDTPGQGSTSEPNWASLQNSGPQAGGLAPYNPQRWDDSLDGADLASLSLSQTTLATRWYQLENGTGRATLGPGCVRGWYRFDSVPAPGVRAFLFDGGRGDTLDRISLYLEGPDRLVLEVHDESLDMLETNGNPRGVRLVYDRPVNLPFRQGNWYHVAAWFRGADRGDLALAVDGVFVGQETHGSRLAQPLDRWSRSLTVEDGSAFPPSGLVRVGGSRWIASPNAADRGIWGTGQDANQFCEVLHYSEVRGNTLILSGQQSTWSANPPLNQTLRDGTDLDDRTGNRSVPVPPPAQARVPLRGSGHRVRFRTQTTLQNGRTRNGQFVQRLGYPHEVGTQVVPYGYAAWLKNEGAAGTPSPLQIPGVPGGALASTGYSETLRVGGGTLIDPLPRNMPYTLVYAEIPYNAQNPLPPVIQAADTEIPVFWLESYAGDQPRNVPNPLNNPGHIPLLKGGFPPFGILRVGNERILYNGIDETRGVFTNCVRGVEGTTAVVHNMWEPVVLETIRFTNQTGYPTRNLFTEPRVYVSLTQGQAAHGANRTEWLSIMTVQDPGLRQRELVFLPPRDDLNAVSRFWGEYLLQQMRRDNSMPRGPNPGRNVGTVVPPLPPAPNPLPQGWQPPRPHADYVNVAWKEVLKRVEPSVIRPVTIRRGRNVIQTPFETGGRRAKRTNPPPDPTQGHPTGTRVCPTFLLKLEEGNYLQIYENGGWRLLDCEVGPGDLVTVMDESGSAPEREERRVAHAALGVVLPQQWAALAAQMGITLPNDQAMGWLVAFDDFVSRPYEGAANARLARWPVGNLRDIPQTLVFGRARDPSGPNDTVADAPGTLPGRVDDFVSEQLDENPGGRLLSNLPAPLTAGDVGISGIGVNANSYQRGRLFRADGEVLAVVDASPGQGGADLSLKRGALTTTAAPISPETALWRMTWPPMAVAGGGFSGFRNRSIPIRQPDGGSAPFRAGMDGGYLRLDSNGALLPYVRMQRGRNSHFDRPIDRFGRGVYRSAFGAQANANPGGNDVLTDLPFRHHDRYAPRTQSLQGVFFQAGKELPGSFVERIAWDAVLPDPHCAIQVAVRVDGAPSWDAVPVASDRSGVRGLYVFNDPNGDNRIDLPATRVELRVYLTYRPRSYEEDAWKDGAVLGGLRVYYSQPTRSLRREERTD